MLRTVIAAAALSVMSMTALAGDWNEVGDAPDGVPAHQATVGVGPMDHINGALDRPGGDHVDTYCIVITDPHAFYATTADTVGRGTGTAPFDSRLWLWTPNGQILLANDDTASDGLLSTISDPSTFGALTGGIVDPTAAGISLSAGTYLLSISSFSNDPEDAAGNDLSLLSDFDALNGPNPAAGAFDHWENLSDSDAGAYSIEMAGATFCIPEPTSLGLLALGALALLRRR